MKHYPKDKCTDREADKIIETITPETRRETNQTSCRLWDH